MPETVAIFDKIARNYDLLNTVLSLGIDRVWRKSLVEGIGDCRRVLDLATGTAEVVIKTAKTLPNAEITGLDPSERMLEIARSKIKQLRLGSRVSLIEGKAEHLPFDDNTFDGATMAFGIRNTVDPSAALKEIARVLKKGGRLGVLEFAVPLNNLYRPLYMFYLMHIVPIIGSLWGRKSEYSYLGESISEFPHREDFLELMKEAGFELYGYRELAIGTVINYIGQKR